MYAAVMKPFQFRVDTKLRVSATALILATVMTLSACWFKAQWITTAEQDLPILINMAESIASLIALTKTVQTPTASEVAAIQHIGDVATQGLQAIYASYQSYTSANATTTIAQIQAACGALTANLKDLLAAAQIKDQMLLNRVTAAVTIIVSTVETFLSLVPQSKALAKRVSKAALSALPSPSALKQAWAVQVGTPLLSR